MREGRRLLRGARSRDRMGRVITRSVTSNACHPREAVTAFSTTILIVISYLAGSLVLFI